MKGPTAQRSFHPQKPTVCPEPATPGAGITAVAAAAVGGEGEVPEEAEALIHVPAMARAPWPSAGSWVSGWQSSGLSGLTWREGSPQGMRRLGLVEAGCRDRGASALLEAAASPSGGTRDESRPGWGTGGAWLGRAAGTCSWLLTPPEPLCLPRFS